MLHEYREEISALKLENAHFVKIFTRHNELDDKITEVSEGRGHLDHFELEKLKKEKLHLKDEIFKTIIEYKNKAK